MNIEDAIDKLHLDGGLLRRKEWGEGLGIDLEDITSEDWEVVETEEEEEYEDD